MSESIFEKSVELAFNHLLKTSEKAVLELKEKLEVQLSQNQHLTQAQLDEKCTSLSFTNLLWGYAYSILSVHNNPVGSHNTFATLLHLDIYTFVTVAGCIRASYPQAHQMMLHVLQYGQPASWSNTIAYSAEIDKLVEQCIENLNNPTLNNVLQDYQYKYQDCNMFAILHACWIWQQALNQKHEDDMMDFVGHHISQAGNLLGNAFKREIPTKYKHFTEKYLQVWAFGISAFPERNEMDVGVYSRISCCLLQWFLIVCVWQLAPTADNKKVLEQQTVLMNKFPYYDDLVQRVLFNPNFSVKEAFAIFQEHSTDYKNSSDRNKDAAVGLGCLAGVIVFGLIIVFIIGSMILSAL